MNWTGEPHATVKIKLDFDGSVVVLSGAADIGQGSSTILVQTVAEVLGLDCRACASSPATARWCRRTTAPIPRA